nr:cadherin repeat domain-containing protein [Arenicellales bacterium]
TNLDFESTTQYVLTVNATDGALNDTADITIDITDVADTSPPPGGTGDTGGGTDDGGDGDPGGSTPDPIEPPEPPIVVDDPPGSLPEGDWPFDPPIIVDDNPDSLETADNNPNREPEQPAEPTLDLDSTSTTSEGEAVTPSPLTPVVDQQVFVKHLAQTIASLRESQVEPSDGFDTVVNKIEAFAQAAPLLPPLELSGKLLDLIDVMKQEMSEANLSDEQFLLVAGALGTTLTLTVGYVAWLLRIGYLATSLLSLTPMLIREFDPLLVLAKRRKRRQGNGQIGDNDAAVDRLFDQNVYSKIERNQLSKPS